MLVVKTASREWEIRFEHEEGGDTMNATVGTPVRGWPGAFYEIARVEEIPCEIDEYGETMPIRKGEEADRLRELFLIAHAPCMLAAIRRALETIDHLVDDDDDAWSRESDAAHRAWCRLTDLQSDLAGVMEAATNVDRG